MNDDDPHDDVNHDEEKSRKDLCTPGLSSFKTHIS